VTKLEAFLLAEQEIGLATCIVIDGHFAFRL
jgi:hypothetical protein